MEYFLWKFALFIDLFLLLMERKLWFEKKNCFDYFFFYFTITSEELVADVLIGCLRENL